MSPEVALLVRAALLGLLVFVIERCGKRRQTKRAELRRTVVQLPPTRYPATPPVTGRPIQVDVVRAVAKPAVTAPNQREIVRLPRTAPAYVMERTLDGHVTEKRAA